MIKFKVKGNFSKTEKFLNKALNVFGKDTLDKYGMMGVEALRANTPKDTGLTSDSWTYEIYRNKDDVSIVWMNSNIQNGVSIAILLQYDHVTGTGGFVKGIDYINPAMKPVFDEISNAVRKEAAQ